MNKIFKREQLKTLGSYSQEVIGAIAEIIKIIDENYGNSRNVGTDLGRYVLIVEIEVLKQDTLEDIIAEYTDLTECKEGINYTYPLFLLSNDFSIVVVITGELPKLILE